MPKPHAGKVAFITGGAQGLGRAFGAALAGEGAIAVLADIDVHAAQVAAEQLQAEGLNVLAVGCDVADESSVDAAVASAVSQAGGIDILVNNAGMHLARYNRPFSAQPRADVRAMFDVNVIGAVNCTLACATSMRTRGGGSIVNISSMGSYPSTSPYGVSKLAVRGVTIAFAHELADAGIRCNAIAPGLVATEAAVADLAASFVDEIVNERQLIHRLGAVDDIVNMLLFLCSDEASFITGETYRVSGGATLSI
ncbi:SDR family NAD(P)-dependent oxidoreductase [Nocardioides massiliensis]|uniref:NAD(P)-dependent dehydrogenase (Short-subunit alcohol dehydrogenase family) n=1 Tax=Nocardioides massiliensis TaxID=1325935 RepID=A0ABT9NK45_9ACTN|nr:SDR family oxidoreductase [Nocardioides massiliensis]MDP9820782.1 NAD(P)-dependent dehydrogenase (short-subunit alcohol dehydrogenase family) [Nocardioides massiliensis]